MKNELESRCLPNPLNGVSSYEIWKARREEIKKLICETEYGLLPPEPDSISVKEYEADSSFCASKATYKKIGITVRCGDKSFEFPVRLVIPNTLKKHRTIIFLNFRDKIPDKYLPAEEICDNDFAFAVICYEDITSDNDDFSNGLAGLFFQNERRNCDAGKLALWAWSAMRVMDFLETQSFADLKNVAVAGHSRLGKTALLTAALDERFAFAYSNDSGSCGAALSRGKSGERIADITSRFPFWFCPAFTNFANRENELPFDQHFLLSLIAPRKLYVSSAKDDAWADPRSELLSCAAASPVYELAGEHGLIFDGCFPKGETSYHSGSIGYHIRCGTHYLGRYDWNEFMSFMLKHENK